MLGKLRSSAAETKLSNYSVELYSTLEQETGVGTGIRYLVKLDCTVTVVILVCVAGVSVSNAIEVNEKLKRHIPVVTFKAEVFACLPHFAFTSSKLAHLCKWKQMLCWIFLHVTSL